MQNNKKIDFTIFIGATILLVTLLTITTLKSQVKKVKIPSTQKQASNLDHIALLSFGDIAKKFHTSITLTKNKNKKPVAIVYGNKEFGYFQTKDFKSSKEISLDVLPFTYKKPINFCIQYQDGSFEWIKKYHFKSPKPVLMKNIRINSNNKFTQNFFLLSAQFVPNEKVHLNRSYLPIIANKYGEIIWAHLPNNGKQLFNKYSTIKPLGNGEYGILFGEKHSYFERFNIYGDVMENIFPKNSLDPYIIHHDFITLEKSKILTLGHKTHYIRNIFSLKNLFKGNFSFLKKPKSFLSTTVELVDTSKNKNKVIWDPALILDPFKDFSWARSSAYAKQALAKAGRHFTKWDEERAQVDWTHANSIEHYPRVGILVSMRNISKVVLLDEKTFDVIWTLGNQSSDTYQTKSEKHAFYHQHHVQLLPNGYILMMDNHTSPPALNNIGSRVSIYGIDLKTKKAHIVWNYQPKNQIHIGNRGSAYELDNKNILAFYPVSVNYMDNLIEIDRKTGQPIAHMSIHFSDIQKNFSKKQLKDFTSKNFRPITRIREGGGNRAVPLETLGKERKVDGIICSSRT